MKTPSSLINQDDTTSIVDKYYGRMPKLLKSIKEADISICNPEYIELVNGFMDLSIDSQNISQELLTEIEELINDMAELPETRTFENNAIIACIEAI